MGFLSSSVVAVVTQTVAEGSSAGMATHLEASWQAVVHIVPAVERRIEAPAGGETLPGAMVRVEDRMSLS